MEDQPSPEAEKSGQEIADVLSKYGEEHGFDPETCEEVATLPFDEAFEAAYGYLTQAGLDPETILSTFMEPPEGG